MPLSIEQLRHDLILIGKLGPDSHHFTAESNHAHARVVVKFEGASLAVHVMRGHALEASGLLCDGPASMLANLVDVPSLLVISYFLVKKKFDRSCVLNAMPELLLVYLPLMLVEEASLTFPGERLAENSH
jgi:hypothetical protein